MATRVAGCLPLPRRALGSHADPRDGSTMLRTLVLAGLLAGCVDFDEPHRVLISDSATNVTDGPLGKIYGELAAPYAGGLVSGPLSDFAVAGTYPNPWGVGPDATLVGTGSLVEEQLELHLTATVDHWTDQLWESVVTGTIQIDLHGTFDPADPYILLSGDATLQAQLAMTGQLAGDHTVAIIQCYRPGILYGYHGVVDGDPVSDHYEGNDPACNVTP
jgi:hypothetical protein